MASVARWLRRHRSAVFSQRTSSRLAPPGRWRSESGSSRRQTPIEWGHPIGRANARHSQPQWRGDRMARSKRTAADAVRIFEAMSVPMDLGYVTPCSVYTGRLSQTGYAELHIEGRPGRTAYAHRVTYEHYVGQIPDGYDVDHLCHPGDGSCPGGRACPHRACREPTHLEAKTHRENMLRGITAQRTHCIHGHEFTPENTSIYNRHNRRSGRRCKACARVADAAYYARIRRSSG